jgi:TonB-dependent starch-binding outer membrane protein SusC
LARLNLSALRVYLSATNLLTVTNYKGVDPEVNVSNGDQNILGYDQAIAPQPRTLQAGFNLSF